MDKENTGPTSRPEENVRINYALFPVEFLVKQDHQHTCETLSELHMMTHHENSEKCFRTGWRELISSVSSLHTESSQVNPSGLTQTEEM